MSDITPLARGLGRIVSGLFILTTGREDEATGMLASFVQQAGFDPPAITVAMQKGRAALDLVRATRAFNISILHDDSIGLMRHYARGFEPGEPAFEGVNVRAADNGVPYLVDAHAHVACELIGEADWSDHVVICGKVIGGERIDDLAPLTHVRKNGLSY